MASYSDLLLRNKTPASTLAGEEQLGSFNKETTDNKMLSTDCVGFHLSSAFSPLITICYILSTSIIYLIGSSPGACKIEIHSLPSVYTLG